MPWRSMLFWYNAVCYMLKLAEEAKDNTFYKGMEGYARN